MNTRVTNINLVNIAVFRGPTVLIIKVKQVCGKSHYMRSSRLALLCQTLSLDITKAAIGFILFTLYLNGKITIDFLKSVSRLI